MSELTNLEICKKIAEIEGLKHCDYGLKKSFMLDCDFHFYNPADIPTDGTELKRVINFNPLEDKALCWDLMIKHGVNITEWKDRFKAEIFDSDGDIDILTINRNPQKAVCLAIIEKHEVSNNE